MTVVALEQLPAMDVADRTARVRERFDDAGVDALLVTHLPNVRYLTGFTGSSAMLLVTGDALVFTSDGRYRTQAGGAAHCGRRRRAHRDRRDGRRAT